MVRKGRRRAGPLARVRSDRERLTAWSAAAVGLTLMLAFWFLLAHTIA